MSNIFDFDESVAEGWETFRSALESQLTGLQAPDTVQFAAPTGNPDHATPTALFTVTSSDEVRCHLSPTRAGQERELSDDEHELLMHLEWDSIAADECDIERPRDEVAHVVMAATYVMQELWQVPHPTFLVAVEQHAAEPRQHVGVQASCPSQLREIVDAALERLTGSAPTKDDDGDVVFTVNGVTSWLQVADDDPVVELFANLPVAVDDSSAASQAIMEFSPQWPDIKFILSDQYLFVSLRMDATVFTDAVLRSTLVKWFEFLTDGSDQAIAAVAESATEDAETEDDTDEGLPAGLMCLIQLDDDGPLSPQEVATVCGFDRDAILHYIRVSEEQRFSWRDSKVDALEREDEAEAAACEHEEKAWLMTVKSLRAALRVVVLSSRMNEAR